MERPLSPPPPAQVEQYRARRAKSVLELQMFRGSAGTAVVDAGGRTGRATLTEINPRLGDWLLLELEWDDGRGGGGFHLENPWPERQLVELTTGGVALGAPGRQEPCELWGADPDPLALARAGRRPYAPLCGGRLYLRNRVEGRKTTLEWATDLLRDRVWKGEQITVFVRQRLYKDAFLETSEVVAAGHPGAVNRPRPAGAPLRPRIDPAVDGSYLSPADLGFELDWEESRGRMLVGRWYRVRGVPGVYLSAIQPRLVAPELVAELRTRLNPLDEVESSALIYMVAFDLDQFDLGFAVGTDHPRVAWSERAPAAVRDERLPGPDGIGTIAPLVATGMVSPTAAERLVATFTGGFKRTHGAFRAGELAQRNSGSHYGFVEHGAVLSRLQPELATALVLDDGTVDLRTWREANDAELGRIRYARQNGVPIVDPDPATGEPRPGELVPKWTIGNWSGSVDKRLRSLRAGLCLQDSEDGRYLLYGYFSSVTPSAMARVFLAYRCRYAMLTDMNALEHTYLALYRVQGGSFLIQHLIEEMSVLDKSEAGQELPRFVGFPDNRDFFYVTRKEE